MLDFSLFIDTVTVRVGKKLHMVIPYTATPEPTVDWLFKGAAILSHMKASQSMYDDVIVAHNIHFIIAFILKEYFLFLEV